MTAGPAREPAAAPGVRAAPAWVARLQELSARGEPFVVVTVAAGRGHVPRPPGSKMFVTAGECHGSVGGGSLERAAVAHARAMLRAGRRAPELQAVRLTAEGEDLGGLQACGGEVTLLYEPVYPHRSTVAIFGVGHVGLALARVLGMLPVTLYLVDSRPEMLAPERLAPVCGDRAHVCVRHAPAPEAVVDELPPGAHLVVLTHDHRQDLQILARALRRKDLGYVGMIGSEVKWARFTAELRRLGFGEADFARVTVPIGLPQVPGRSPEAIAIATAAQLLAHLDPTEID